ncbi:hypothetical protein GCM10010300_71970 [Streptomyces olivaceoviridis]|uniref:hypothetical protein n=1 Tax=Streptomyces olivaceoviridis TaxID=1921 RepID=UPI00167ADC23|nr:hypothetical protein [Streptomyces olivaceoviridis]GGZ17625.1 hypothetical protein GCM10010300_71970 [Streptomyces olivaceoviridis]
MEAASLVHHEHRRGDVDGRRGDVDHGGDPGPIRRTHRLARRRATMEPRRKRAGRGSRTGARPAVGAGWQHGRMTDDLDGVLADPVRLLTADRAALRDHLSHADRARGVGGEVLSSARQTLSGWSTVVENTRVRVPSLRLRVTKSSICARVKELVMGSSAVGRPRCGGAALSDGRPRGSPAGRRL